MRFFQIHGADLFWDILQSIPIVVLLASAVWYWTRERRWLSMACALIGAFASSLLIHSTKPLASDYGEPCEVTIVTVVTMSLLQILLVAYLGTEAEWSNWKADLGLGSIAGISLAVAQGPISQGAPWIGSVLQGMGLAAASILMLLGIRKLKEQTLVSAVVSALLLAVVMTLLAKVMGYRLILD